VQLFDAETGKAKNDEPSKCSGIELTDIKMQYMFL